MDIKARGIADAILERGPARVQFRSDGSRIDPTSA
jgi:hypothetical protein